MIAGSSAASNITVKLRASVAETVERTLIVPAFSGADHATSDGTSWRGGNFSGSMTVAVRPGPDDGDGCVLWRAAGAPQDRDECGCFFAGAIRL